MGHIILTVLRTALLLLSTLGYTQALSKKLRPEFAPFIVLTSIGSAVFFAGILNILQAAAWLICAGGVLLALRAVRNRESFRPLLCPGCLFFAVCAVYFLYVLYGAHVTQYDNFSHWAVVTKLMLEKHRFPIASDPYIVFQSYPLGSASYIYYAGSILGIRAEWLQTYWQTLLLISALACLFAFAKRRGTALLTAVVSLLILTANEGELDSLLVDKLLACVSLGAAVFCLFYRDELQEKLWWTVPPLVFLTAVKNSGLLFVALVLLYVLARIPKKRRYVRAWLGCALCPAAALLLWQRHVKLVFPEGGLTTKHSMTLQNFALVFGDKTPEDVLSIAASYLRKVFSLSDPFLFILLALGALYLFERFVLRTEDRSRFRQTVLIVLVSYAAYMVGMFAMYLFTMPLEEAVVLASFDRYYMTVLVFLAGIVLAETVTALDALPPSGKARGSAVAAGALLVVLLLPVLSPSLARLQRPDISGSRRDTLDMIIRDYGVEPGKSYLFLMSPDSDDDPVYLAYVIKYLLAPANYTSLDPDFMRPRAFLLQGFDYLIALDDTEDIRSYMGDTFGDPDLRAAALNGS